MNVLRTLMLARRLLDLCRHAIAEDGDPEIDAGLRRIVEQVVVEPGSSAIDIAVATGLTAAQVAGMVESLVAAGILETVSAAGDVSGPAVWPTTETRGEVERRAQRPIAEELSGVLPIPRNVVRATALLEELGDLLLPVTGEPIPES